LFFCLDTKEPKNQGGIKLDAQKTGVSDRNSAKNKQPNKSNGNTPGIVLQNIDATQIQKRHTLITHAFKKNVFV